MKSVVRDFIIVFKLLMNVVSCEAKVVCGLCNFTLLKKNIVCRKTIFYCNLGVSRSCF